MRVSWLVCVGVLVLAVGAVLLSTGCENGDDSSSGDGGGFVGVWALYEGTPGEGTPNYYAHFMSDGSFYYGDGGNGPDGGAHLSGSYTVTDGKLVGPFTNPGVGEGQVEATITDGVMSENFIEFWHEPHKVVPHTGIKQ